MSFFAETGALVLMFVVRLAIPLLVTMLIVYALRRLDARWQAEAQQRGEGATAAAPHEALAVSTAPCWQVRRCPPQRRDRCPAYLRPNLNCWAARNQAEGRLPDRCLTCILFKQSQLLQA
jgi:hypothetical protein